VLCRHCPLPMGNHLVPPLSSFSFHVSSHPSLSEQQIKVDTKSVPRSDDFQHQRKRQIRRLGAGQCICIPLSRISLKPDTWLHRRNFRDSPQSYQSTRSAERPNTLCKVGKPAPPNAITLCRLINWLLLSSFTSQKWYFLTSKLTGIPVLEHWPGCLTKVVGVGRGNLFCVIGIVNFLPPLPPSVPGRIMKKIRHGDRVVWLCYYGTSLLDVGVAFLHKVGCIFFLSFRPTVLAPAKG